MGIHIYTDDCLEFDLFIDKKQNEIIYVETLNEIFKTEKYFIIGYQSKDNRLILPIKINGKKNLQKSINSKIDGSYFIQGYEDLFERNLVFEDIVDEDVDEDFDNKILMN